MNQIIRIIGGVYRGKKIVFPNSEGLRPTPDRVRETLFNWLMHDIKQSRCLDAFAGSGALGLEAFSRGASEVCLVEQNRMVFNHLQTIVSGFNSPKLTAINADASHFIRNTQQPFDVIFLDPPFQSDLLLTCLNDISRSSILKPGGLVYIESSQEIALSSLTWETLKRKKAGQVFYGLLRLVKHEPEKNIDI